MRLTTYNLMNGENPPVIDSLIEIIEAEIKSGQPFVMALQEIPTNLEGLLIPLISLYPEIVVETLVDLERDEHTSNLATISNLPINISFGMQLNRLEGRFWKWLFKLKNEDVPQHRALTTGYIVGETQVVVINAHLEALCPKAHRTNQILQLREFLSLMSYETLLLMGDLNAKRKEARKLASLLGLTINGDSKEHSLTIEYSISSVIPNKYLIQRILKVLGVIRLTRTRKDWIASNGEIKDEEILYRYKESDHFPVKAQLD